MAYPRNELLLAIGNALHEWSGVEFALAGMFEVISDINGPKKSNAVFDTIISFDTRLDVVHTLMTFEAISELEMETWKRFEAKLKKKYKKRHQLAHFSLLGMPNGDAVLSPFWTFGTMLRDETKSLSPVEISAYEKDFMELRAGANWLKYEAMRRRGLLPSNPMPEPLPISHCRELAVQILEERSRKQQPPHNQ